MRLTSLLATCSIALLLLSGCGDSGSGSGSSTSSSTGPDHSSNGGRTQIGIIPNGNDDYWNALHAGAVKGQLETARPPANKPTIDIVWRDLRGPDNTQAQLRAIEDMLVQGVAAIILAPSDAESLKGIVERAADKHVPIIIINSALNSEKPRSFVGTDEKRAGDHAGQFLGKLLAAKGKVIVLHAQTGTTSAAAREEGFKEAMKDEAGLQLIPTDREGGETSDTAYSASKRLLAPFLNADGTLAVDGIFTPTESTTQGMLRALEELKLAGKVKFVGYGTSDDLLRALTSGELQGLVLSRPSNMGYLAVKTAVDAIKEKKIEKRIDSGTVIATKENLASPETQEILHPDLTQLPR